MNDYENAVLNYSHAIRLNPKSAETYFDRGTAYEMLRRYDAALSDYRKAANIKIPRFGCVFSYRRLLLPFAKIR